MRRVESGDEIIQKWAIVGAAGAGGGLLGILLVGLSLWSYTSIVGHKLMMDRNDIAKNAINAETLAEDADIRRRYPLPWSADDQGAVRDAKGMVVVNRAGQFPLEPALARFIARFARAEH